MKSKIWIIFIILLITLMSTHNRANDNKLMMITADYCVYCQIWEKEIGTIYHKTDIAKIFPLERIELDKYSISDDLDNYETKITPTFVFFREKEEIGRIIGYSSAEMFWWQVDEILDRD